MPEAIFLAKGTSINFTTADVDFINECAHLKVVTKDEVGLSNRNIGYLGTAVQKESMAIGAELAFSRMMKLPDFDISQAVNNFSYDFLLSEKTIDIKSSKYTNARLFTSYAKSKKKGIDIFCLICQNDLFNYTFLGSATFDELVQVENFSQPQGFTEKVYWLPLEQLTDLEIK